MTPAQPTSAAIWSAVRTLLGALGGYLVGRGLIDQQTMQDVLGAVMVLAPLIWGVINKFRSESKMQVRENIAVQAGVQAERDGRIGAMPAENIGPDHAQAIIQAVKEEKSS